METAALLLIEKIASVIENEATLLSGVRYELDEIKLEFNSMKSLMEDVDKKGLQLQTEGDRTWVSNVRDIAYDVEDIIDEILNYMNKRRSKVGFIKFYDRFISASKNLWMEHQFATKLQTINRRIKAIEERHSRYGGERLDSWTMMTAYPDTNWVKNHAESTLFSREEDLVGISDAKQKLMDWLLNVHQLQRTVISVYGMGGSGKTTLAAKSYDNQVVKRHFDYYAWITVSQNYVIEDLFRIMIKEFCRAAKEEVSMDLNKMSYRELVEFLVNYLHLKRYVVVLDDVWDIKLWREMSVALPDGIQGSRVMITTRFENIASFSFGAGSYIHHISPLGENESWVLFCMKAFSINGSCPPELKTTARNLVRKCGGLPLAIVALGGLMSSRKLESEWLNVYKSLNIELSKNPDLEVVKSILLLSFNSLPYLLKHCFLYCSIFPEDHWIKRKRVIRLWIAEGFAKQIGGVTPEEEAERCLMELIRRSMLQVVYRNACGRPKRCKMHDLMRELALSMAEREKFLAVCGRHEETGKEIQARRLSIQGHTEEIKTFEQTIKVRSLFLFVSDKMSSSFLNVFSAKFRLLRVLDLENAPINKLPRGVSKLFNLRYLNLRRTQVKELPKCIGKLHNLETLDIWKTGIKILPAEIAKLHNLQRLIMSQTTPFPFQGTGLPFDVSKLKKLHTLCDAEAEGDLIEKLKNMTQLKTLGITKIRESDGKKLCISIQNMKLLQSLYVTSTKEESLLMDSLVSPPPHLKRIFLYGKLQAVPKWFQSLQSLVHLHLCSSRLREDVISSIQMLPNLAELWLEEAHEGKKLGFLTGFQKLSRLYLINLAHLKEIVIEKGVMSDVESIHIEECKELKTLPHGFRHLTGLQQLDLVVPSPELIDNIRGEGGVERSKVRHIRKITHFFMTPTGLRFEDLS